MSKGTGGGTLATVLVGEPSQAGQGVTGALIGSAYKAALVDFLGGHLSKSSAKVVGRLLEGAVRARLLEVHEDGCRAAPRNFYLKGTG